MPGMERTIGTPQWCNQNDRVTQASYMGMPLYWGREAAKNLCRVWKMF